MLLSLLGADGPAYNLSLMGVLPYGSTFTRASSASFLGSNGLLQAASTNVARYEYSNAGTLLGLLYEAASTNYVQQSALMSGWYAEGGASISTDAGVNAPDGVAGVRMLTSNGGNMCRTNIFFSVSFTAGQTYVVSAYVKAGTARYAYLTSTDGTTSCGSLFDLQTGTYVGAMASGVAPVDKGIIPLGNGWFRIWHSWLCTTSGTSSYSLRPGFTSSTALTFPNDAVTAGLTLYVWGAQLEAGSAPSSYIATVAASATRATDSLSFNIPDGIKRLRYVFWDYSYQDVAVTAGAYTVPTTLSKTLIRSIQMWRI